MVSKGQFVGLDCEWVVILYLTLFSFLKQWEIYDAYVEDLQKQVRLDGCFLFWLTVFLRSDTIPYNNNEYLAYSLQIGA